jgi:putative transposase
MSSAVTCWNCERWTNARSQTVREAFERIFERHGLPEAIRSDNGAPFASVQALHGLSRLSAWWVALGIDLERGRPAHPQDNGGHERLHRDIAEELESLGQGATPEALELWREEFNRERPHEALGMRCPAELYRDSSRRYRATEVQLSYPGMATRLVDKNGKLSWKNQKVFLTGSLAGWEVGLQRTEKGQLEIWFGRLLLGHLDPQEVDFLRSEEASRAKGYPGGSLESSGRNWRLTHNRLFPGRRAAAT